MTKKKYGEKDDEQEEFIDSIQKNIVNSSNDGRHELFKWAFKLVSINLFCFYFYFLNLLNQTFL